MPHHAVTDDEFAPVTSHRFQEQKNAVQGDVVSYAILVVDDDASVRKSTLRLLAVRGYTVHEAASAAEAFVRADQLRPDAILMDLHMQHASGMEAARQLKAVDTLKQIPIIAFSATPPAGDESQLFVTVLRKPCPSDEIVQAIESALHRRP
jgi:CheY-like chemotaxis protein